MSGHERERLSAYLDRELPPDERAAVEAHLSACPECAAFLAELAVVDEAVASLPAEPPEGYFESFPARVRSRLEPPRAASPGRRVPAWTWAAAAALLLAVVTPLTLRHLRSAPAEPPPAPAALQPPASAPEPKRADEGRRLEPPSTLPFRPVPRAKGGPVPARGLRRAAPRPAGSTEGGGRLAASVHCRQLRQSRRARDETADARAPAGNLADVATAESAAESAEPARSARRAGAGGGVSEERPPEGAFRRLEAARPRSAVEWRRLRDEWNAFAAAQPDRLRADEARVRAIVAGREAWLIGGDESDEDAFRRDAAAYLRREDARQKPRVERLLAEPRRAP